MRDTGAGVQNGSLFGMVADKLWTEGVPGTLRWRSNRTTNQSGRSEGPLSPPTSTKATEFADLYEEHARAVLRYCQLRIADPAEAEDTAALIFTRAFSAWPPANPECRPRLALHHRAPHGGQSLSQPGNSRAAPPAGRCDRGARRRADPARPRYRAGEPDRAARRHRELSDDQREVVELRLAGLTGPRSPKRSTRATPRSRCCSFAPCKNCAPSSPHHMPLPRSTTDEP